MERVQSLKLWAICIFLCAGNGVPFFCTLYIPNTAQMSMQNFLNESVFEEKDFTQLEKENSNVQLSLLWSVFISEMAMGQFFGYIISSPLIDQLGRRNSLFVTSFMQIPAQMCHILAQPLGYWPLLYVGRILSMLVFAISTVIVPVFLSEIAPTKIRGSLGIIFPLSLSIGALLGGVLGTRNVLGSQEKWPYAFVIPLTCSLMTIPLILFLPETPTFLASQSKVEKSKKSLQFYHGNIDEIDSVFQDSAQHNRFFVTADGTKKKVPGGFSSMVKLFRKKSLRRPLFLTLSMAVSFCCAGIAVVSAYSTAILTFTGLDWHTAEMCTIALKVLSFINYIICLFLVDRLGRRPLLLGSLGGCAICWTFLVACTWITADSKPRYIATTAAIFGAQFFMNIGVRPLFYVLIPELFPFRFRTAGKSLSAMLGTLLLIPILFGFWPLLMLMENYVYIFLAGPLWICFAYMYKTCPETKGRQPADIFRDLKMIQTDKRILPETSQLETIPEENGNTEVMTFSTKRDSQENFSENNHDSSAKFRTRFVTESFLEIPQLVLKENPRSGSLSDTVT